MAAITQISRIQHRTGLYRELPSALNEAELGWALDSRQLFIGNGPIHPGNTEIITQYTPASSFNYSYKSPMAYQQLMQKGAPLGLDYFTASTGYVEDANNTDLDPTTFNATIRSYQEKFDEFVSVKDYKAVGDFNTDDTGALIRATKNLFSEEFGEVGSSTAAVRRNVALYLPAGVYRIRQNLVGYPGMTLIGDPGKTIIYLDVELSIDDNDDAVLISGDSYGQVDFDMGTDFGDGNLTPSVVDCNKMYFYGISFQSNQVSDVSSVKKRQVVRLNRLTDTIFEKCTFDFVSDNNWQTGDSIIDASSSVLISSFNNATAEVGRIKFIQCSTSGAAHDFNIIDGANDVIIDRHQFNGGLLNVKIGTDVTYDFDTQYRHTASSYKISNITISNSIFNNYTAYALDVFGNATSVISFRNRYNNTTGKSIRFGASTTFCSSMSDWFANQTSAVCGTANPRIDNFSATTTILNAQDFTVISLGIKDLTVCGDLTVIGSVLYNPASSTNLTLATIAYPSATVAQPNAYKGNSVIVNYAMRIPNGGTNILRTGTIKIIYFETTPNNVSAANISFSDDFVEIGGSGSGLVLTVVPDNSAQNIKINAVSSLGTPTTKTIISSMII
ncbi:MAG: hypothetical protein M0R77_02530 [Gammaproteobacteria bacterium]|nr:hypothetical protein [Gammaproteobacteria bacterium]